MIDRLIEEQGYQVCNVELPVAVNYAVSGRDIEVSERSECEHIGSDIFLVVHLMVACSVAATLPVRP